MKLLTSRKASELLGVHPNTLRRWANDGKIKHIKTPAGQRLYDIESFVGETSVKRKICYCRVSRSKQKDDLERQIEFMRVRYPTHEIVTDIGSGLNFKRKGLLSILESVCEGEVEEILVAHQDRLVRFGFDLIRWIVEHHGGKLVVFEDLSHSPQSELVRDLLAIIGIFSTRVHGLKKYKSQIKEDSELETL